jgi:hypothetical protein
MMASKVLRTLGERGLVTGEPDPDDARSLRPRLTGEGRRVTSQAVSQRLAESGERPRPGLAHVSPSCHRHEQMPGTRIAAFHYWPNASPVLIIGAFRVRAAAGLPIIAATTITLAVVPISKLHAGAAVEPHEWLRWAQLGGLALLWVWALRRLAARQWTGGGEAGHQSSSERKRGAVLVGVLAVVVAYYALEFVVWGSYAPAGRTARGTGFLLDDLSFQAVLLPVFLTLVVLLGSTDLLGWGELIAARVPVWVRPSYSWIFLILTPLTACLVIANALRIHPGEALPEVLVGAVLAGIVGLLVRLGTGYTGWSDDLRAQLVFVGAIVVFIYTTVFSSITEELATAAGLSSLADSELYWLISTPVLLALLTVGLFLVARGKVNGLALRRDVIM